MAERTRADGEFVLYFHSHLEYNFSFAQSSSPLSQTDRSINV